jgi:hypothetical protein
MSMASKLATSSIQQQPPAYILQSWRREQLNLHDAYLLQQTFIIAPDTTLPFSRLRQRIRNIYEERIQPMIVVHYDPWEKKSQIQTIRKPTKDLVKNHTTL